MLGYRYVFLGSGNDYTRIERDLIAKECDRVVVCKQILNYLGPFKGFLFRLHCSKKTNRFFNLPFKEIWVKYVVPPEILKGFDSDSKICFCITGMEYEYVNWGLLKYLRKRYPSARFLFFFTDVEAFYPLYFKNFSVSTIKTQFDLVVSYNSIDVERYDLVLNRPMILSCVEYKKLPICYDVFFVGRAKDRLDTILRVAKAIKGNGFTIRFYLLDVPDNKKEAIDGIYYLDKYMPYTMVLNEIAKSRCILNIQQHDADGITMREYEALYMNKMLISDSKAFKDSPFFTEEKMIGLDNLESELWKLNEKGEKVLWKNCDKYSASSYFEWLDSLLNYSSMEGDTI